MVRHTDWPWWGSGYCRLWPRGLEVWDRCCLYLACLDMLVNGRNSRYATLNDSERSLALVSLPMFFSQVAVCRAARCAGCPAHWVSCPMAVGWLLLRLTAQHPLAWARVRTRAPQFVARGALCCVELMHPRGVCALRTGYP